MKRIALWIALAATAAIALSGCSKQRTAHDGSTAAPQVQSPATTPQQQGLMNDKVAILSFDGLTGSLTSGVRILLTVRNDSAAKITLTQARITASSASSDIATATLAEPVELARRTTAQIALPLRLSVSNPLYAVVIFSAIRSGNIPDIYISLEAEVSALGATRKINIGRRPLAEAMKLLNIK